MNKHGGYHGINKDIVIDFSVNVNPLGVSQKVLNRISESINQIAKYPEIDGESAKGIISEKLSIEKEKIILGNGASELIYLYARAIKPNKVLIIQPTFNEYERAFKMAGAEIRNFINDSMDSFKINIEKLIAMIDEIRPDVVILCNPNNPTGMFIDQVSFKPVLNKIRKIDSQLFLDESFIDFTNEKSYISLIEKYPIFILRSMTKFYAIPGLRLGYGIGNKNIIKELNIFKEPWTLNSFALSIVGDLLEDDGYKNITEEWYRKEKKYLYGELRKMKYIIVYPSFTNFFICKLKNHKANTLRDRLLENGIYIRICEDFQGLDDTYFRIAVRNHEENEKLIKELNNFNTHSL